MGRMSHFVDELRRRNVFRTGVAYIILAWLVLQVADIILPVFNAPDWILRLTVALLGIGFPIALVLAWVFEITTSGVKRTEDVSLEESITHLTGRKLDFIIIGVLVTALSLSLYANLRSPADPAMLPDPVSILIADFENDTGNELFTNVLEDTLRIGIEAAQFIESYPRIDARQLASDFAASDVDETILSLEVARQVAIRQGIDIVVGGHVRQSDDDISVEISGMDPAGRIILFELSESADEDDEILAAIARLAREFRAELGDTDVDPRNGDPESFWVANLNAASEYLRAQELQAGRNLEDAVLHFSRAIELDPQLTHAYAGRALAEFQLGMSDLAARDWEYVMSRLGDLTERDRLRTLGNYYVAVVQDWQKALETYERLVERYPADSAGQNNVAVAAFFNLEFERALSAGRKVAERFPAQSLYKANLALYALYSGEFEEAHSLAQETIKQDPQNGLAWVATALAESQVGNPSIASDTYRKMMEVGRFTRSHAYEGMADLAMYEQDYAAAVEILTAGIASDLDQFANDTAAIKYMTLAEASLALGQRQEALDAIERGLRIGSSDNSDVRAALLLTELSEFEKAVAIADALSNDSSRIRQAYAATIRASIASSQDDPVRAVEFSKTAIETADLWLARYVLGHVYLDAGFPVEAYNEFQICGNRAGETLAIFLDERPTFRITRDLAVAIERTSAMLKQPNN